MKASGLFKKLTQLAIILYNWINIFSFSIPLFQFLPEKLAVSLPKKQRGWPWLKISKVVEYDSPGFSTLS